jgi:heme exporter protein A
LPPGPRAENAFDKDVKLQANSFLPLSSRRGDGPPETDEAPLLARNLTRAMNGHLVLDRAELAVRAGEVVALLGENGAGKTTLLKCLAGRLRQTAGEVLWFGTSPQGRPESHRLVGFAAHESFLYPELSAGENLLFAARMFGLAPPQQRVADMLALAGLSRRAKQPAGRLSQGLKKRLSLVRALLHDPPIVILDEPFAALDDGGRQWLEDLLADLRSRKRAIIFASHDRPHCCRIAGRLLELRGGRIDKPLETGNWLRVCA